MFIPVAMRIVYKISSNHPTSHPRYKPVINPQEKESQPSNNFSPIDNNLPRNIRSGLISRLGKFSIALLIGLFLVYLGYLIFFAFLWGANTNNNVWRSIILSGWTTRSITITSLVLR